MSLSQSLFLSLSLEINFEFLEIVGMLEKKKKKLLIERLKDPAMI